MKRGQTPPSPAFDPTIKAMVEIAPPDWVRVFAQPMGLAKVVDADIATTIRGAADKVIRVAAKPPYLLHLDFQAGHFAAHMPASLHLRNVALQYRHSLVVVTGLVLLKPEADSPQWTGTLRSAHPGQEPETIFHYRVLRVWQHPPDEFLQGIGTLPLAPVSAVTNAEIPDIMREVKFQANRTSPGPRNVGSDLCYAWPSLFVRVCVHGAARSFDDEGIHDVSGDHCRGQS